MIINRMRTSYRVAIGAGMAAVLVAGLAFARTADAQTSTAAGAGAVAWTGALAAPAVEGIDVSHHQADRGAIDWAQVRAAGQSFVFIKATEGHTYTDPKFRANDAGARAAGLFRAAYHFARPDATGGDAVREAAHFVGVGGAHGEVGQLPPVLDLEDDGGLSDSALVTWTRQFLTEVERLTGRVPIIYTGPAFWEAETGNSTAFTRYPLWIAHYTSGSPRVPGGWGRYTFWQNTSSFRVPGVTGTVDHNFFNGTSADLARLANGAKPSNPYTPVGVCGTGYSVIDQEPLRAGNVVQGTVYLLYHSGNGNNCVVTLKETSIGTASPVAARLQVQGRSPVVDSGSFAYYAGPVRATAPGMCVKWGGTAGTASYDSPFEHCG